MDRQAWERLAALTRSKADAEQNSYKRAALEVGAAYFDCQASDPNDTEALDGTEDVPDDCKESDGTNVDGAYNEIDQDVPEEG